MKTYHFRLASATDTVVFDNLVRVIRYDEGSGTGTPKIRVKALSTGEFDVELIPGRQIKLPEIVRGLVITNLTDAPITGKLTIGAGDISDNSLVGTVTLDAATLAALELTMVNERPEEPTGQYSAAAALSANTAVQVFAAGANQNGCIVYSAGCSTDSGVGDPVVTLLAKAGVPVTAHDGLVILRNEGKSQGSSWQCYSATLPGRVRIPAGVGLYWISTQATPAASHRHCAYKML